MNKKTVKKLIEAKFPFSGRCGHCKTTDYDEDTYGPSLSELIEACGSNLEAIIQRGNGKGDNWEARSKSQRFNASRLEEAVANLWLEINKT